MKLPGAMWGISVCFNPAGYGNKYTHLRQFAERVRAQGLKLLVVELAMGGAEFALGDEVADVVVRRRSDAVLWQKEALLNVALKALPPECDKVAWLDADILFENEHWVAETAERLEETPVVQPFTEACWLVKDVREIPAAGDEAAAIAESLPGTAYARVMSSLVKRPTFEGHPGFAWAARRALLEKHGFYDRMIVGGGDLALAHAFFAEEDWEMGGWTDALNSSALLRSVERWTAKLHEDVRGGVGYTPGRVFHLWHGEKRHRRYVFRTMILRQHEFDPEVDVELDEEGLLRWASEKPAMRKAVGEYFVSRKEEG